MSDIYGNAISGATIAAQDPGGYCGSDASAQSGAGGAFSVDIPPGTTSDKATISATRYATSTVTLELARSANPFTLQYSLNSSVGPAWVQAGKTVTISATSGAPLSSPTGYLCAWGGDQAGVLGNGSDTGNYDLPVPVEGIGGTGSLSGVVSVVSTEINSYALLSNGTVVAWGEDGNGQLGTGDPPPSTAGDPYSPDSLSPVQVEGVGGTGVLSGVTAIAAGNGGTAYALLSNGTVVAWGSNWYGALGNGNGYIVGNSQPSYIPYPEPVVGIGGSGILSGVNSIAASVNSGYALLSNGTVAAWGEGQRGQFDPTTGLEWSGSPVLMNPGGSGTLSGVVQFVPGDEMDLALLSDSTVVWWGWAPYATSASPQVTPVEGVGGTGTLTGVKAIAAGWGSYYFLMQSGQVVAWGADDYGQLGNGSVSNGSFPPTYVAGVGGNGTLSGAVAISAQDQSAYARLDTGQLVSWGYDVDGQLGNGNTGGSAGYVDAPTDVVLPAGLGQFYGSLGIPDGSKSSDSSNSGFSIRTRPCNATTSAAQVIAQLPDGSILPLTQGATDSNGITSWSGSYTVPSGTANGTYGVQVCGIDAASTVNCAQAQALGAPAAMTPLVPASYGVDDSAPTFSSTAPVANTNTTSVMPAITVTASDPLSGINPVVDSLTLDGQQVASGGLSYTPGTNMPLGVHTVVASATTNTGVSGSYSWQFDVVGVTSSPGIAQLDGAIAPINFPPNTTQVAFQSVPIATGVSWATLSSSIEPGLGMITTTVPLAGVNVGFSFASLSSSVAANLSPLHFGEQFAVLAPNPGNEVISVGKQVIDVGPVIVNVPTQYQLTGGTATLTMSPTQEDIYLPSNPLSLGSIQCSTTPSVGCHVVGQVQCSDSSSPSVETCDAANANVFIFLPGNQYGTYVAHAASPLDSQDTTAAGPNPDPLLPEQYNNQASCSSTVTCANLLAQPGASDPELTGSWSLGGTASGSTPTNWSAGVPLFSVFSHHRYYEVTPPGQGPLAAVYEAANAHPGSSPCVLGSSAQITSHLATLADSVQATAPSWSPTGNLAATTGTSQRPQVVLSTNSGSTQLYALGNYVNLSSDFDGNGNLLGQFESGVGSTYQASITGGGLSQLSNSAYNSWAPTSGSTAASASDQELLTVTEFGATNGTSQFAFTSWMYFDYLYNNSQCSG